MHYLIRAGRDYGKAREQMARIVDEARLHLAEPGSSPMVVDVAGFLHSGTTDIVRITFERLKPANDPRQPHPFVEIDQEPRICQVCRQTDRRGHLGEQPRPHPTPQL